MDQRIFNLTPNPVVSEIDSTPPTLIMNGQPLRADDDQEHRRLLQRKFDLARPIITDPDRLCVQENGISTEVALK
jgi:hypothetical protein